MRAEGVAWILSLLHSTCLVNGQSMRVTPMSHSLEKVFTDGQMKVRGESNNLHSIPTSPIPLLRSAVVSCWSSLASQPYFSLFLVGAPPTGNKEKYGCIAGLVALSPGSLLFRFSRREPGDKPAAGLVRYAQFCFLWFINYF